MPDNLSNEKHDPAWDKRPIQANPQRPVQEFSPRAAAQHTDEDALLHLDHGDLGLHQHPVAQKDAAPVLPDFYRNELFALCKGEITACKVNKTVGLIEEPSGNPMGKVLCQRQGAAQ